MLATASNFRVTSAIRMRAYTLIELVVVITILGVLAAIAGPRFFDTQPYNQRGYADEVSAAMRYSQKIAIATGCNVSLTINLSGYSAFQQPASGNTCNSASSAWTMPVVRLDGSTLAGTPPSNANVDAATTLVFNNHGAVISGAATLHVGTYTLALDVNSGFARVQ